MKKSLYFIFVVTIASIFTGCAKENLLINTYAPPAQMDKVKELMAKTTSNQAYLDLYIHENIKDVLNGQSRDRGLAKSILAKIKDNLTQTNFIGINQNGDSNTVSLYAKINKYSFSKSSSSIDAFLEIGFEFIKDAGEKPIFTQTYSASEKRSSRSGSQGLPSEGEIQAGLVKDIVTDLILDVSPIKGRKLVELKSLPKEIAYTINFAKMHNYKGAIKAMLKYQGEKTLEYYFNLAVYYEALASSSSNMKLLEKANENYEQAMAMGGSEDDVVIKAKAKFDTMYDLIETIDKQKKANKSANINADDEIL